MKKRLTAILVLALSVVLCFSCAFAEDWTTITPEGWQYVGYTYGGVTFAVPPDYQSFDVTEEYAAAGYILIGGSREFTLVLRQFQPDQMDYDTFKEIITGETTADCQERDDNGMKIITYRNTAPGADSELFGIALTGLDGLMYKISIFTGEDGDYSASAPVWQIAENIGKTTHHQDFSAWGIEEK